MPSEAIRSMRNFLQNLDLAQATRFIIVGFINTGFSYLIYAVLLYLGLNFVLANLGAVVLGILFSFRTQGRFVFHNTDRRLLGRFFIAWAAVYFVTISIIGLLGVYDIDPYTAGALALPISALASFFMQKYFVFR